MRHVVECNWYGPQGARPAHRRVVTAKRAAKLEKVSGVLFTDNSWMSVSVRPCKPRERVAEIRSYDKLMDIIAFNDLSGTVCIGSLCFRCYRPEHLCLCHEQGPGDQT